MMYYHVMLGTKHFDLIKADSEEEAVKKIERAFGPAIMYSSVHNYRAVKA